MMWASIQERHSMVWNFNRSKRSEPGTIRKKDNEMNLKLMVSGVLVGCCMAVQVLAGSVCSHVDLAWLSEQVRLPKEAKIVLKQEQGNLCEVVVALNGNLAPLYAGKDFILTGQMYRKKQSLTRETMAGLKKVAEQEKRAAEEKAALAVEKRKTFFKTNHASLEPLVAMTFDPGNARCAVYVVTDPNCHHCKELLPRMEKVALEAGVILNVIINPVLGEKSRDMAAHVLCNNLTYDQYRKMTGKEPGVVCERSEALLPKTRALFASAGISFVPLVVAGDGSWVVEGSDINAVRAYLGLESEKGHGNGRKACGPGHQN